MKILGPFGEEILFSNKVNKSLFGLKNAAYFVDKRLKDRLIFKSSSWVKYLPAGEQAKTWNSFQNNLESLIKKGHQKDDPIVVVGGGSLGDSLGFLASVYQRGVPLILVPSTWLAAIDSTVGGKTALNFEHRKNQVGSFYAPQKIFYFKDLLATAPLEESRGEILKTLFLNHNRAWARKMLQSDPCWKIRFNEISHFVEYKSRIVKKDPLDAKGIRAVLNFGHTLGHLFELEFGVSHSEAVEAGLRFSLNWSHKKKSLSDKNYLFLIERVRFFPEFRKLRALEAKLGSDKKSVSKNRVNFIFLSDRGPFGEVVSHSAVSKEFKRQVDLGIF